MPRGGGPERRWGAEPEVCGTAGEGEEPEGKGWGSAGAGQGASQVSVDTGRPGRGGKTRGDADGIAAATADPWVGGGGGRRGRGHTTGSKRVDSLGPGDSVKVGD